MSRFERLCWAWAKLNGYALATIGRNPDASLFRFEDIFESEERYQNLACLVAFASEVLDTRLTSEGLEGWLDTRINVGPNASSAWEDWSLEHKQAFDRICGALMEKLGYEFA
jgi:hypothetical protein